MKEKQKAPDFELKDQNGKEHKLSDYKGKKVVLYFYPEDDTPGCTTEACSFRDNISSLRKKGAIVLGISADNEKSHKKFEEKYSLNFPLLADTDREVINKYGVWGEKSFMGKKFMGILRTTYIIDEKGIIKKIFENVKVDNHTEEVLKEL